MRGLAMFASKTPFLEGKLIGLGELQCVGKHFQ